MSIILTAQQAKQAREAVRLSQGKISSVLGINRTYLSLFESGKYIFDDQALEDLRKYYEGLGYDFQDEGLDGGIDVINYPLPAPPDNISNQSVSDGVEASSELPVQGHTELLTEYEANRQAINDLASQEVGGGLFSDWFEEPGEEEKLRLITLMARNYSIHEEMKGHHTIRPCDPEMLDNKMDTVGEMVGAMFSEVIDDR